MENNDYSDKSILELNQLTKMYHETPSSENKSTVETLTEDYLSDICGSKKSNLENYLDPARLIWTKNAFVRDLMLDRIEIDLRGDFSENQKYTIIKYKTNNKTKITLISVPNNKAWADNYRKLIRNRDKSIPENEYISVMYQHNYIGQTLGLEKNCIEQDYKSNFTERLKLKNGEFAIVSGGYIGNKNTTKLIDSLKDSEQEEIYQTGYSSNKLKCIFEDNAYCFNGESSSYGNGNELASAMFFIKKIAVTEAYYYDQDAV
jgi:uncharacterized protein YegP (UPF0339 family)